MNKSKNITIPICLILLIQVMLCCSSCSKREKHQIDLHYLNNLADTVYTGQERMVFLTNGVGGWYFDDAFKSKTRGTFGYNRKEEKVLSNWELLDLEGNSLLDDPLFCVTFPTHIERHYSNEIIERIEMPLGNSGISFEFILPKRQGVIFRPYFDFRHLEYEESVDYITLLDDNSGTLCAAKEDMSGGWVAVSSSAPFEWRETIKIQRQNYSLSELTGRPGSAIPWSPGEVSTKPGRKVQFAVGWGKDKVTAINTSNTIVSSVLIWRENRVSRIKDVLDDVVFSCDNRDLVKAFDWARIVANQFVYEENERINIFTGFPYTPFPTGWGTFLSISEMLKCGISSNDITEIIESTIEGQKQDKYSPKYGMLPSSIKDGENEYLVSEIAGLMVRALMKLKNQDVPDRFRITETMISATKANLIGTAIYRVKNGMVVSDSLEHFLADSPGAPLRGGAAIENQVLYSICREFFKDRNIIPDTSDFLKDIPGSLLKGVGLEAFNSDAPFIVVGETSKYSLVLRKKLVLSPFTDNSSTWFGDYVPINPQTGSLLNSVLDKKDRISQVLAYYWYRPDDEKGAKKIFDHLTQSGLIGESGIRSLSTLDEDHDISHIYLNEGWEKGTKARGDVLVWTNGLLGDIYKKNRQIGDLESLIENLKRRILSQGVAGALPEAENSVSTDAFDRLMVGDVLHLHSTLEFIRNVQENLLGLDLLINPILKLHPRFPQSWGETSIRFKYKNGHVLLNRTQINEYNILQTGIEPYIEVSMDIIGEKNERGLASFRLHSEETVFVNFVESAHGRIQGQIRR